jgi:hypothetical protein
MPRRVGYGSMLEDQAMLRSSAAMTVVSMAIFFASAAGVAAQSEQDPHDRLIDLDMLTISKGLCGFAMTGAQADAISGEADQIIETLNMSYNESQKLYDQLVEQMTRQKPAGLCAPKGAWAKLFAKMIADLHVATP